MKINGITPQPTADPHVFTLPSVPNPPESLQLFLNGDLQYPGRQFELSGARVNFLLESRPVDWLIAWYETGD